MSLWVDKYRPTQLHKLDYHPEISAQLKRLVDSGDFPHLLFYGPPGAGKKTRIMCTLRELYGAGVEKLKIENLNIQTPSNKKIELTTINSNYHLEFNPSDAGFHDRVVIQEVLKNIAQMHTIDLGSQKGFKVVVLNEVDKLTRDAQHSLRRTMEKYSTNCRLILCCNSTGRVISPIRSRCLGIRVPAPSIGDITRILHFVCKKEGVSLPTELSGRIAELSRRNLRRALLMVEACRVQQHPMSPQQPVPPPDWELYVKNTANLILMEQSPKQLLEVRGRVYELMAHVIPPDVIMKHLLEELLKSCDGAMKAEVVSAAAQFEHRIHLGSKPVFHIEAFVAKFMSMYKRFLEEGLGNLQDIEMDF